MTQNFLKQKDSPDPMQVLKMLSDLMGQAGGSDFQKAQTVGAPLGPYIHGPGGLFGVRGLSRDVISTHTNISGSLGELIPISPSNELTPLFPYITGYLRSDEKEKDAVCDNPPEANHFKTCIQTTVFGRKEFKTRQLEVNHIGQVMNRGEFTDLTVLNSPLVSSMGGLMSNMFGMSGQNAMLAGREMTARLVEVGVAYQRWLCPQVFTGNPASSAAGGGYKEFTGLDLLIGKNKIDVTTGQACPSLYSDVKDFVYREVDSTTDPDLVKTITTMYRILQSKARQQGLGPADIRLVMREPLFYAITEVWPCRYMSYRCVSSPTTVIAGFDTMQAIDMRNSMRSGQYLLVDNIQVPVILDDCIMEENNADNGTIPVGGFASDIYFVPFSARGGTIRTLYWEYYDYSKAVLPDIGVAKGTNFFWSDGGVFLWGIKPPDNWCLEVISKFEPRLILRTPQLAGRLTNVVYTPLQHTDDPLPSQDYFVNGGVVPGYPASSPYAEFNPSGPGVPA
jgi:hypothetical protein